MLSSRILLYAITVGAMLWAMTNATVARAQDSTIEYIRGNFYNAIGVYLKVCPDSTLSQASDIERERRKKAVARAENFLAKNLADVKSAQADCLLQSSKKGLDLRSISDPLNPSSQVTYDEIAKRVTELRKLLRARAEKFYHKKPRGLYDVPTEESLSELRKEFDKSNIEIAKALAGIPLLESARFNNFLIDGYENSAPVSGSRIKTEVEAAVEDLKHLSKHYKSLADLAEHNANAETGFTTSDHSDLFGTIQALVNDKDPQQLAKMTGSVANVQETRQDLECTLKAKSAGQETFEKVTWAFSMTSMMTSFLKLGSAAKVVGRASSAGTASSLTLNLDTIINTCSNPYDVELRASTPREAKDCTNSELKRASFHRCLLSIASGVGMKYSPASKPGNIAEGLNYVTDKKEVDHRAPTAK